jgi:Na+-driven multidrug efflux pump
MFLISVVSYFVIMPVPLYLLGFKLGGHTPSYSEISLTLPKDQALFLQGLGEFGIWTSTVFSIFHIIFWQIIVLKCSDWDQTVKQTHERLGTDKEQAKRGDSNKLQELFPCKELKDEDEEENENT